MEHPLAYVRRIAVNLAIDGGQERSRSRAELGLFDQRSPVLGPDESAAAELLRIDTRLEITWVLAELPRRQRAVIVLRYFEDLSEAEIATYLGWPLGTVKSTASRALERLQRVMDDANPTPTSPVANE
jgi:RNA polymerase sigma factor (sigma-70 family)